MASFVACSRWVPSSAFLAAACFQQHVALLTKQGLCHFSAVCVSIAVPVRFCLLEGEGKGDRDRQGETILAEEVVPHTELERFLCLFAAPSLEVFLQVCLADTC